MKLNVKLTADELLNVVDAAMVEASDRGYDPCDEEIVDDMLHIVDAALSAMGIEIVKDTDTDTEDKDEEEDMESIIYDCDGHRGISADDARLLMQCVAKVMKENFAYLPDEVVEILIRRETLRISGEWGIEVVDVGDE